MISSLLALAAFAFVSSITPGPNNLMLMASGANFGFARTIPHMLGVGIGFTVMVACVGAGLMQFFDAWPMSYAILRVVSLAYLCWLAYRIARASAPEGPRQGATPMTFLQAAAFQWVNPKAWAMALTAITLYAPSRSAGAILLVALVFGMVNLPSVASWAVAGRSIRRRLLDRPTRLRAFNWTMAALLLLSTIPMI